MKSKSLGIYLIELVIVIAGVTIAFWLNTQAESSKEAKIRYNYYSEFLSDLDADQKLLERCISNGQTKIQQMRGAIDLYSAKPVSPDSILKYAVKVGSYDFFTPSDFTYNSMINSGDFKLINDREIKRGIVRLYKRYNQIDELQSNHLQALDENYFPVLVQQVDYTTGQLLAPIEKNSLIKNYFAFSANELSQHIRSYQSALKAAQQLDSLIAFQVEK